MSDDTLELKDVAKAIESTNKAWEASKAAQAEMADEIKKFGSVRAETEAKFEKIDAAIEAANKVAEEAVLAAKRSARVVTDANGNEIDLEAKAAGFARMIGAATSRPGVAMNVEGMTAYKGIMETYMRKGMDELDQDERKALSVGGDANGGYVVSPDMSGAIVAKRFETSPMRAYASIQTVSTDALEGLYDNDEAGFGWVGETAARGDTDTPDIGRWRIEAHEMYANPKATQKLLDDAEINMEAWLAGKVADRFARAENAAFVAGNGVLKPRGFLTYPNGTDLTNSIEQVKTGVNGAFAAAPNGGDVLIDTLYSLKAAYRANATWFANRATQKLLRKLKDSDGAYLWSPGIAAGQPATVLGYPIASFEDMPNPATGSLSMAVGDMRSAYQIVDRIGIRTLRDPYTAKPYVTFYTTKRVGGAVTNGEAIKLVQFSA